MICRKYYLHSTFVDHCSIALAWLSAPTNVTRTSLLVKTCGWKQFRWHRYLHNVAGRRIWRTIVVPHVHCENKVRSSAHTFRKKENLKWLTELREWKAYKNVNFVQKIKCVKVRALFPENKVRFARAEELCDERTSPKGSQHGYMPKIHYTRFPVTSLYRRRSCQIVTDFVTGLLAIRPTSERQVVEIEFGKRHDTTDTTDFGPRQLVTDLLRGNCCNGFWPILHAVWSALGIIHNVVRPSFCLFECSSICKAVHCGSQGRCRGLKVVLSSACNFLFTSPYTFAVGCVA